MIQLGAAYYPELWEESEIGRDIERCREYGIGVLRVGEFAWGKWSRPRDGLSWTGWSGLWTGCMMRALMSSSAHRPARLRAG